MKIVEYSSNTNPLHGELKYWNNLYGEYRYRGEYEIEYSDLPEELKEAHEKLWRTPTGFFHYLAEYGGVYGVAIVYEVDEYYCECNNSDMEEAYEHMKEVMRVVMTYPEFESVKLLVGKYTGDEEQHEFVVFIPGNIKRSTYNKIVARLDDNVF